MADRSFEEQVRVELADMQLVPEPTVWVQIDRELRRENKRRGIIWFLLLGALVTLGSAVAYHFYHHQEELLVSGKPGGNIVLPSSAGKSPAKKESASKLPENISPNISPVTTAPILHSSTNKNAERSLSKNNVHLIRNSIKNSPFAKEKINEDLTVYEMNRPAVKAKEEEVHEAANAIPSVHQEDKSDSVPAESVTGPLSSQKKVDSLLNDPPKPGAETANEKAMITIKPAKAPWQWYASVEMGESRIKKDLVNFRVQSLLAGNSNNSNVSNSGSLTATPGSASTSTHPGFSFGGEVEARKAIGRKWDLGIMLGYQYLSTRVAVGKHIDSAVVVQGIYNLSYYPGAAQADYTNKYHFISAGISLYRNFHFGQGFVLRWQIGAGLHALVANSALHHDPSTGIWLKNNAYAYNIEASVSTGFEAGIGKNPLIFIGPQIDYFVTPATRLGNAQDPQHLFRAGIKLSMLLPSRKKAR